MVVASLLASLAFREDSELASLRTEIVGKRIWLYGATISCGSGRIAMWDPREPVTVLDVRREPDRWYRSYSGKKEGLLYGEITPWNTGGNWGPRIPWGERTIRIEIRLPRDRTAGATDSMLVYPLRSHSDGDRRLPVPETASFTVANRGELWRFSTPVSPWETLSRTSGKVRNAFARRDLAFGMPRTLVALLLGDPDPGAGKKSVWTRKEWSYDGGSLDSYIVVFDAQDRVSNFGVQLAKLP